jgi:hypothetical protein
MIDMLFNQIKDLQDAEFKRVCGVDKKVFSLMVISVNKVILERETKRGNDSKLIVEDQILVMLGYYREYRTMFHIGIDIGVSESTVCRIIMKIEDILIKDKLFQLPPKKSISNMKIEAIIVDATELTIQRPKKNK